MPIASGNIVTGAKSSIGTTAVQLTSTSTRCVHGVLVLADPDNSGDVYVGREGVTAGTADATDGVRLRPGDAIEIEIDEVTKVYVIGSAAGQKVFWAAL